MGITFAVTNWSHLKNMGKIIKKHIKHLYVDPDPEADSGLVKLVVMTNVFFNNQQHEIETRQFICMKQIKSSFFSNKGNQLFCS